MLPWKKQMCCAKKSISWVSYFLLKSLVFKGHSVRSKLDQRTLTYDAVRTVVSSCVASFCFHIIWLHFPQCFYEILKMRGRNKQRHKSESLENNRISQFLFWSMPFLFHDSHTSSAPRFSTSNTQQHSCPINLSTQHWEKEVVSSG